jgi:hypothetical protein
VISGWAFELLLLLQVSSMVQYARSVLSSPPLQGIV